MQFGRYHLLNRIAVGGMGEVFLAEYSSAAGALRHAVVKRILPHLNSDPNFVAHFLTEGRITSLLTHPNIVQTIELGRVGQQYYIALEHIPGQPLVRLLAGAMKITIRPSIPLAFHIAMQLASALQYIHSLHDLEGRHLQIIHMDVSPHNVLITPEGNVALLDFGIARAHGLENTDPPQRKFRGRTAYLAPEQLDGLNLDARVDLFALGILLHEVLLTRPLFRTKADSRTVSRILYSPIPSICSQRPDCPESLERIVLRLLERRRGQRYQTADELLGDLEQCGQEHDLTCSAGAFQDELANLMASKGSMELDAEVSESPGTLFTLLETDTRE